jgi:nickel-type superoxide dismutase maturation protease
MKQRFWAALAAFLGLGALGGAAFLLATRRFEVEGSSMLPTYAPGDRVLVHRFAYVKTRPKPGDVVVVRLPGPERRAAVKRVAAGQGDAVPGREGQVLGEDEWWVLGDNAAESTDSRHFGPVHTREIVGKVLFKY